MFPWASGLRLRLLETSALSRLFLSSESTVWCSSAMLSNRKRRCATYVILNVLIATLKTKKKQVKLIVRTYCVCLNISKMLLQHVAGATFQVLDSGMWLVATIMDKRVLMNSRRSKFKALHRWFPTRVILLPRGPLEMSRDISGCHNWEKCYWHLVGRSQKCCLTSYNAQDSTPHPHDKELSSPQYH